MAYVELQILRVNELKYLIIQVEACSRKSVLELLKFGLVISTVAENNLPDVNDLLRAYLILHVCRFAQLHL